MTTEVSKKVAKRSNSERYRAEVKRSARTSIWWELTYGLTDLKNKVALVLVGPEDDEIKHLLSLGFQRKNIILVDENPNNVRRAARVHRIPKKNCYPMTLAAASDVMMERGVKVDCANLDLCATIYGGLQDQVLKFIRSGILKPNAGVSITYSQRIGIHAERVKLMMDEYGVSDHSDLLPALISKRCDREAEKLFAQSYQNGPTSMAYVVMQVAPKKYGRDLARAFYRATKPRLGSQDHMIAA